MIHLSLDLYEDLKQVIKKFLKKTRNCYIIDFLVRSKYPWASPILLIKKK